MITSERQEAEKEAGLINIYIMSILNITLRLGSNSNRPRYFL